VAKRRARLVELAEDAGRSLDGFTLACLVTLVPVSSVDAAIDRALGALKLSGLTRDSVRAHYLLGDDDALVDRVAEYRNAGVDHLLLGCLPGAPETSRTSSPRRP
jgi:alkanesulfonate monooxygenase SsuD/methylene tetrahydromethanopterin reductase-like flavin-dependent oxidoreductase (luciferase family)